jgi:hypothetical protein
MAGYHDGGIFDGSAKGRDKRGTGFVDIDQMVGASGLGGRDRVAMQKDWKEETRHRSCHAAGKIV